MRIRIIYAIAAVLLVAAWVSRAGNAHDARVRSHCAAIGYELQVRAARKTEDIDRARAVNPAMARRWDDYLGHITHMGRVLDDTFAGPQPTEADDLAWASDQDLPALAHAGEGCTGEKR